MRKLPVIALTLGISAGLAVAPGAALAAPQPTKKADAAAADVQGKWNGTAETPDGAIKFGLLIDIKGDVVSGELMLPEGVVKFSEASWSNGELRFGFVHPNGDTITAKATLEANKLKGRWGASDGGAGGWEAERAKDK